MTEIKTVLVLLVLGPPIILALWALGEKYLRPVEEVDGG